LRRGDRYVPAGALFNIAVIGPLRPHPTSRRPRATPPRGAALAGCLLLGLLAALTGPGAAHAQVSAAATDSPCFGAAARDPESRCVDPSLKLAVVPSPEDALLQPNAPCKPLGRVGQLFPCTFGAPRTATSETTALIGDSHAAHWRGAVNAVAEARGWHGVSLTRAGCPLIKAKVLLPDDETASCEGWNTAVIAWLRRHREVTTIFVSQRTGARFVHPPGVTSFETAVRGYMARWRSLPATVKSVFVIRDTPRSSNAAADCVRRTHARRQPSGVLCARRRSRALQPDPAVTAARRLRSPRVHVLDMTSFFCDPAYCYEVVGGALVHKDVTHITSVFAQTLGPYLLEKVEEAVKNPGRAPLDALLPDERRFAECLLAERELAKQAGGWSNIDGGHLVRAKECRAWLEERAQQIKAAGLTGTFNRANRYAAIRRLLDFGP
jgi:hypothetical protein